jgi:hypothetical protein
MAQAGPIRAPEFTPELSARMGPANTRRPSPAALSWHYPYTPCQTPVCAPAS